MTTVIIQRMRKAGRPLHPTVPANASSVRVCPQCDCARRMPLALLFKRALAGRGVSLIACFVYLENAPAYERLLAAASSPGKNRSSKKPNGARSSVRPTMWLSERKTRWRLRHSGSGEARMLRRTFAPGRVLDVGCGIGNTIPEALHASSASEVSDSLARIADEGAWRCAVGAPFTRKSLGGRRPVFGPLFHRGYSARPDDRTRG